MPAGDAVHPRTRTPIPHNKFIVKLVGGAPPKVWTGSTNFTDSGFFGQTNVGHRDRGRRTSKTYLDYWTELQGRSGAQRGADERHRAHAQPAQRHRQILRRCRVLLAAHRRQHARLVRPAHRRYQPPCDDDDPFNVAPTILTALAKSSDAMRLVILEDPPSRR